MDWDQVEATLITLHGRMSQAGLIGLTLHDGIPFGALNDMDVRGLPKEATLDSTILNILPELEAIEFRVAWLDPVTGEFSMSGDPLCGGGEVPNTTYTVSLDPLGIYRDRVSQILWEEGFYREVVLDARGLLALTCMEPKERRGL